MYRFRPISFSTFFLFSLIIFYHSVLKVNGKIIITEKMTLNLFSDQWSHNLIIHAFEVNMLITFALFVVLGTLAFLCFYNRTFLNTVIMWLVSTFVLIIDACIRLLGQSDHISLIIVLNFLGLITGFLIMHAVINILYNLITDVSTNKL